MPDENKQNAEEKDSARKGPKWQDASYKQIYSSVDVVIDLLKKFVDPNVVGDFDPQSFERLPDTFINKNLSERREDKIWRFKTKNGGEFYIFLILEFQTKNVYEMGLRIVEYIALFVMELFRTGKVKHHEKVPNILPIVIYTGKSEWTAPRALSDLFETPPLSLKPYQLDLSYIVIDVVALAQESVSDTDNLSALVFRLERCKTLQELIDELKRA
ncbi:MAG: Rpn family recombination-promoting nuclease/putative transposase, partial [Desulfovibrionaceae bacterium]|nr:Rpn family recombination-promoting nuclease/putative transposase [Desulfovibrionaceae bacterium]